MPTRSRSTARWASAALSATSLLLIAGAAPAFASDDTYMVQLRQDLPRTATTNDGGAPQQGANQCPGTPAGQDGWHFVLPGNSTDFVKLTVTFEPGGQQVVTDFGPPSDKHAYVASAPGAQLTSAVAEVEGGDLELFNLSHTCPASVTAPDAPVDAEPGEKPTEEPVGKPSEEPVGKPTEEPVGKPSEEPSDEICEDVSSETSSKSCEEPSGKPSNEASTQPAPAASPNGTGGGDLAETGAGPTISLAVGAAVLLGAGGYLLLRRRKAAAQQD